MYTIYWPLQVMVYKCYSGPQESDWGSFTIDRIPGNCWGMQCLSETEHRAREICMLRRTTTFSGSPTSRCCVIPDTKVIHWWRRSWNELTRCFEVIISQIPSKTPHVLQGKGCWPWVTRVEAEEDEQIPCYSNQHSGHPIAKMSNKKYIYL